VAAIVHLGRYALPSPSFLDELSELSASGVSIWTRQSAPVKYAEDFVLFEPVDQHVEESSLER
jgi:hypothetical protein